MKKTVCAVATLLLVGGCAPQPNKVAETSSGKPGGIFRNTTADVVSNHLVGGCAAAQGVYVSQATPSRVECGGQLQGGDAVLAQMLIGNSYSTTPEQIMNFTLVQQGKDVRVYGESSLETIMAFGQPRRVPLQNNAVFNEIQEGLWRSGAEKQTSA